MLPVHFIEPWTTGKNALPNLGKKMSGILLETSQKPTVGDQFF